MFIYIYSAPVWKHINYKVYAVKYVDFFQQQLGWWFKFYRNMNQL